MSEELKEIVRLCNVIKEKDKEIERLYNLVNIILRRIANLEREVEKYEGF